MKGRLKGSVRSCRGEMTLDVGGVVGCGLSRPIISKVSMPATLRTGSITAQDM